MSDLLLSFCKNCGKELPSYAFSFCPNCETPVTKDSHRLMVKDTLTSNFGKLIKLADSSDAASDILRNATSDPKFTAVAKRLVRNSPTIIETIVGFTPLAPFSKVIGDVLQNATKGSTKSNTEEALEQFCIECGFKLKINSKFCRKCGARQEDE
jgi:predicted amidophosphoribosyltransferase